MLSENQSAKLTDNPINSNRGDKMKPTNKKQQQQAVSQLNWITFNVGGTYFATSRSTLMKGTPPNSPLHRVSNGSTNVEWDRDERGAYMVDRDPMFFQALLNFLRHGCLVLGRDLPEEGLLIEAEYFNVPELVKLIKQRICMRQQQQQHQLEQQLQLQLQRRHYSQQSVTNKAPQCYHAEIF